MSVPVDFQLNADTGPYVQSMSAAVAISQQYSNVADGARGKVANLSSGLVGATLSVTQFNKANSVATDTAASSQKMFSSLAATASATGRSYEGMTEASKKLARDFPIGIQAGVEVVQSLQSVGAKSEGQMKTLGKSFVELGAATGTNAAQMGRDFALLGKSMGNGLASFSALSDSLTTVTQQLGASPGATVAFSKALAPIASTVGMGQTAVMGLSAAMSSLGEDGYRAANVFNKVLLDMNKSIRDGGPELKAYADIMGTTSTNLRDLFKSNPTEMLTQFTEALGKSGQGSQRLLENLGFDSVRDTRSLQALSRSGTLRGAIDTSVNAYGSGSTANAAGEAMGGVLDSATKLKETMGQTVENIGKPMLGMVNAQLKIATGVADVMQGITGSEGGQKAVGAMGAVGMIGGGLNNVFQAVLMAAMAKGGFNMVKNSDMMKNFQAGREAGKAGMTTEQAKAAGMGRAGVAGVGSVPLTGNLPTPTEAMTTGQRWATQGARTMADLTNRGLRGYYGNVLKMGLDEKTWKTPEGQAWSDARKAVKDGTGTVADRTAARQAYMASIGRDPVMTTQAGNLLQTGGAIVRDTGRFGGAMVQRAGGLALQGARATMGALGPTMGIMAGMAIGGAAYSNYQEGQTKVEAVKSGADDIYASANAFSEATGRAGRGLISFTSVVAESTTKVANANTSMAKALDFTAAESSASLQPGYQSALKTVGNISDPKIIAAQLEATLGQSASPEDVARAISDVGSKWGPEVGKAVADEVKPFYLDQTASSKKLSVDFASLAKGVVDQQSWNPLSWLGMTDGQQQLSTSMQDAAAKTAYENSAGYAGTKVMPSGREATVGQIETVKQAKEIYDAAKKAMADNPGSFTTGSLQAFTGPLSTLLKIPENKKTELGVRTDAYVSGGNAAFSPEVNQSFEQWIAKAARSGASPVAQTYVEAQQQGLTNDYSWAMKQSDTVTEAKDLGKSFEKSMGANEGFTASLFGAADAATAARKALNDLPGTIEMGMSGLDKSLTVLAKNMSPKNQEVAGAAILKEALKASGGNTTMAQQLLQGAHDNTPQTEPYMLAGLEAASAQLANGAAAMQQAIMGPRGMQGQQMQAGWQAQQTMQTLPANSPQAGSTQMSISMGQGAEAQFIGDAKQTLLAYGQMQAGIMQASRQAGIQMGAIARDGALKVQYAWEDHRTQEKRAQEDYNIQVAEVAYQHQTAEKRMTKEFYKNQRYAKQDHERQEFTATRDFDKQMTRAGRDHDLAVFRAGRDNQISIFRMTRDFNKAQERALEDFNKQKARAEEDYNKSTARARRDFNIQQTQAMEDYNKQRGRMLEDYNKQVKRMVEDSAKQMYDPYKRIAAAMVMDAGQLVQNLKDQTKQIQGQVDNLAKARAMGLSEEAIKALNLADAANAQQLARLVADMGGNKDLVSQLNTGTADKNAAAGTLVKDQGNTNFARQEEDFKLAQDRMAEDFKTATDRATEAFGRQMEDAEIDYKTSVARMEADFAISVQRSTDDFNKQMADNAESFANSMNDMEVSFINSMNDAKNNFATSMADLDYAYELSKNRAWAAYIQQMEYMDKDLEHQMTLMYKAFKLSAKRADEEVAKAVARIKTATANAISDVGAQLGASIASMKESFLGLLEVAGKTPKQIAQGVVDMYDAMGGPIGTAQQQQYDNAVAFLEHLKLKNLEMLAAIAGTDLNIGSDQTFPGFKPSVPETPLPPMSRPLPPGQAPGERPGMNADGSIGPIKPPELPNTDFLGNWALQAGIDIMKGLFDGISSALGSAWNWLWDRIFKGQLDEVDTSLERHSPSKYFFKMGVDVVQGLIDGILSLAGNIWHWITDPIKDMDIMGKITAAMATTTKYLQDLGTNIASWVSGAWDSMWKKIEDLNIGAKVTGAFATARDYLQDLGNKITTWVSDSWNNLWNKLETFDIGAKVTAAFNGAKTWIQGLWQAGSDHNIGDWIATAWNALWSKLPTFGELKEKVIAVFTGGGDGEGISGWLGGLAAKVTSWLPSLAAMKNSFMDGVAKPFASVADWIQQKWNDLSFTTPAVEFTVKMPKSMAPTDLLPTNWVDKTVTVIGSKTWDSTDFQWPGGGTLTSQIPHFSAMGNIFTRPSTTVIAEAGYPEAVIPLNDRGAAYMANIFQKYLGNDEAKGAMVNPYSTYVTNNNEYSYDHRTQYTGPITVQASDPDEMNAKLQAKQRRARLANPVGAR